MTILGRARRKVYRFRQRLFLKSMSMKPYSFAMLSHKGRVRTGNEDSCAASTEIGAFVVCDGMGGAAAGEVASKMASEAFLQALAPDKSGDQTPRTATPDVRLDSAIHAANKAVFEESVRNVKYHGMGTTLVALLLGSTQAEGVGALTLAHVGDSRCYVFRDGILTQLTQDHSLVEEQVRLGELTPLEAEYHPMRNIITRAVGSQAEVEPEIHNLEPKAGDLYLLCSDGLTRELSDTQIASSIQRFQTLEATRHRAAKPDLTILCRTLIDEANDAGGGDNITVLLLHLAVAPWKINPIIAVVGAGTMGNGIAHVFARSGYRVLLADVSQDALANGVAAIRRNLAREVAKEKLTAAEAEAAEARIAPTDSLDALGPAMIAIEAATERFEIKAQIFKQLDSVLAPEAILASNTSSISITKLAALTRRPGQVIGMHFFNPVPVMKLVEIIRGLQTTQATFDAVHALSLKLGKIPVEVNDAAGFVSNRVLMPLINEACFAVMEGVATPEAIDTIFREGMAHPMGPLTLADFIGLDVCLDIMRVLVEGLGDPKYRPCPLLARMVDAGWLGRKSGRGFYTYN